MLLGKERLAPDTGGSQEEFWRWLSRLLGPSLAERARTQTEQIQPQGMQRPALARAHAPALLAEINQAMGQTTPTQSISPQEPESGGTISWNATGPFREREFQVKKFTGKPRGEYEDLLDTLRRQLETEIATNFGEIPGYAGSGAGGRERAVALASILAAMQGAKKTDVEAEQDPLGVAKLQLEGQKYTADRAMETARETASAKGQYDTFVQELKNRGEIDSAQAEFMGDWMLQNRPPDPAKQPDEFAQWMLQFALQLKLMKRGLTGGISADTEAPPLG